jgi:hypothetical protein
MLVETCVAVAAQDGPSAVVQMLSDLGPADEQAAIVGGLWRVVSPHAATVLQAVAAAPGQAGRQGRPQGRLQAALLEPSGVVGSYPLDERTVCPQDHHCRLYAPCQAIYHLALTKRHAMQFDDHQASPPPTPRGPSRAVWVAATATALLVAVAAAFLMTRSDGEAVGSPTLEAPVPPTTASPTTTTIVTETEVVARLREILRVRDRALQDRNTDLLGAVYTVDCPCLEGDTNAIKELVSKNYRLVGGATSIRVRRTERVTERLWLVIADFKSAPLRIETAGGELVRQEPAGSDLFQFALARPVDADEWLLGRASSYEDG